MVMMTAGIFYFCRTYSQQVDSYKKGLADAKQSLEAAQKKAREAEALLAAKDKIINDLRLQVAKNFVRMFFCLNVFLLECF
jgi:hypothetical protein